MVSKKLMDIAEEFDEDIEELANRISLTIADYNLTADEYYIVRHKIGAKLREDCKTGEMQV